MVRGVGSEKTHHATHPRTECIIICCIMEVKRLRMFFLSILFSRTSSSILRSIIDSSHLINKKSSSSPEYSEENEDGKRLNQLSQFVDNVHCGCDFLIATRKNDGLLHHHVHCSATNATRHHWHGSHASIFAKSYHFCDRHA